MTKPDGIPGRSREILWVDPHIESRSPTMKGMIAALPYLLDKGWKIRLFCIKTDVSHPDVSAAFARVSWMPGILQIWAFRALILLRRATLLWKKGPLVHDTGAFDPGAAVRSIHFDNATWTAFLWRAPHKTWKDWIKMISAVIETLWEKLIYGLSRRCVYLPVSTSLASRLRQRIARSARVEVLPNVLQAHRFHPGVREAYRTETRQNLSYDPHDLVFIFVAQGHYVRKGFWLAIAAVNQLRKTRPEAHFLAVGVTPSAENTLTKRLDLEAPDWRSWVKLVPPTLQVERYYSAADAFLFPSMYETFALVSLEASACGLPLLLTEYDGMEMYFQDQVNGILLPRDPEIMAQKINSFLDSDLFGKAHAPVDALSPEDYADKLDKLYSRIINTR